MHLFDAFKCIKNYVHLLKWNNAYILIWHVTQAYDRLLITSWGHDPGVVPSSNVLTMLNDALTHSAVLIQVIQGDPKQLRVTYSYTYYITYSRIQVIAKRITLFRDMECTDMVRLSMSPSHLMRKTLKRVKSLLSIHTVARNSIWT